MFRSRGTRAARRGHPEKPQQKTWFDQDLDQLAPSLVAYEVLDLWELGVGRMKYADATRVTVKVL